MLHYSFSDGMVLPNVDDLSSADNDGVAGPLAALSDDVPFAGLGNRSLDPSDPLAGLTNIAGVSTVGIDLLENGLVHLHGGFTMECWFRWDGGSLLMSILDYAGTEKFTVNSLGEVELLIGDFAFSTQVGTATPGQWHYVAAVFDTEGAPLDGGGGQPGMVTTYFDSTVPTGPAEATTKTTFGDSLNRPIAVGMHAIGGFSQFLNGRVFEPRISLGALEPSQLLLAGTPGQFTPALQPNADAVLDAGVIQLTPAVTGMEGSAFTIAPQPILGHSFQAFFSFRMTVASGTGADGVTFVVQNDPAGAAAIGSGGGGLGLSGIDSHLAVVYDSFEGAGGTDHEVRLVVNDQLQLEVPAPFLLNDGNLHYSWIEYSFDVK